MSLVINCAGIGARELVHDADLEPHRGQVAIVPRIKYLPYAVVCDDAPLMYAIPRRNDCVFGGTNDLSDDLAVDSATTARIVAECSRELKIDKPNVLAERVGLRPFRKSGVRLERDHLRDGRTVVHNYGHGGSGFTLSWGCAQKFISALQQLVSNRQCRYPALALCQRDALKGADDVVWAFFGKETFVITWTEVPIRSLVIVVAIKSPHAAHHDQAADAVVPKISDVMETQVGAGVGAFKSNVIVKHDFRQTS